MSTSHAHTADLVSGRSGFAALFARPRWIASACIVALAMLGWLYLGYATSSPWLAALCKPLPPADLALLPFAFAMWAAMVLAMMLPSAAPMILTYAEIGETAARKGERIVSPAVLVGGYALPWLGFAGAAATMQALLAQLGWLGDGAGFAPRGFAGLLLIGAGLFQFTALKSVCLTQCSRPFPFLFAHWQTTAPGVFRLGMRQGGYCIGCCWAMMLLMFAVGTTNVLWMAGLGATMTAEKLVGHRRFTYALGLLLLLAGVVTVAGATGWFGAL